MLQIKVLGVRIYEYLLVLGLYLFFAYSYHLTLWINRMHQKPNVNELFDFNVFMAQAGLDYTVKLFITIPIWWLIFQKLRKWPQKHRIILHVIFLPTFVFLFQKVYYFLCEIVDFGHLESYGQVWDLFIPGMFYCIQFGIFHTYSYHMTAQRDLKLKAELKEAALKSELAALKAQLNPHFLYNVFNTINASLGPEQEETREMIAKLADLFRYQLKASKADLIPLHEELIFIQKYLDLEKARFGDRLRVEVKVPDELLNHMIPPMLIQPLVENSIKHGIAALREGGSIQILIQKQPDGKIHFEIRDTGIGIEDKSTLFTKGVGLRNTRLRLEKQYATQLKVSDNLPNGLKVAFSI